MPTWIDLFDGPLGNVEFDPTPMDPLKPSVHEWQRFGDAPTGNTHVSGSGGLDGLQPLRDNAFASFGGRASRSPDRGGR